MTIDGTATAIETVAATPKGAAVATVGVRLGTL
jgi:hypothetical protein